MKKNRLQFLLSVAFAFLSLAACKKQDNWQSGENKTLKATQTLSSNDYRPYPSAGN